MRCCVACCASPEKTQRCRASEWGDGQCDKGGERRLGSEAATTSAGGDELEAKNRSKECYLGSGFDQLGTARYEALGYLPPY